MIPVKNEKELREFASFVKNSTSDKKSAIITILSATKNEKRFYSMYEFMKNNPEATFNEIQYKESEVVLEEVIEEQEKKR